MTIKMYLMNLSANHFKPFALPVLAGMLICSCSEKDQIEVPSIPDTLGRYEISLRATQEEMTFALRGMEKPVCRVESGISWLEVNPAEPQGNTPVLHIKRVDAIPESFKRDSIRVYFNDSECASLIINKEGQLQPLGDNSDDYRKFNTRWWEEGDILYNSSTSLGDQQITERILLPWAPMTTSNIPNDLFYDPMTSAEGWQMAYNLFAGEINGQHHSKPYFVLYNKYSGIMRVFYYQREETGTAGEFAFIFSPADKNTKKYPFYHSLQYGIPIANGEVQGKAVVEFNGISLNTNTFEQYITPYRKSDGMLKKGWYCFDVDLSAYRSESAAPFGQRDVLSLDCITSSTSAITLLGSLEGGIDGGFKSETSYSTTTSNGLNYLDQFNSGISNITECIKGFAAKDYLSGIFRGGLSIYNFTKSLFGYATDDYQTTGKTSGTINMNIGAVLNVNGTSFSHTSHNAEGVDISYTAFSQSPDIGKGVWSLQKNPVVYVVDDCLLGDDEDFVCTVDADDYGYGVSDPEVNNLRLMTFLDPESIRLNLRSSLFKNMRNAHISWIYGVYPNQPKGHTDPYRLDLMNLKPDEPVIADHSEHNGEVYSSIDDEFGMHYMEYPLEMMEPSSLDSDTKAKIYKQNGADYRYYGHAGNNEDEASATFFITDPIVMLPTTYDAANKKGRIRDFEAPDFFVAVLIDFEYLQDDGRLARAVFSKRFIPEVKAISTAELKKKRDSLTRYVKRGSHQSINGVAFKNPDAGRLLSQFFATSKYILDQQSK